MGSLIIVSASYDANTSLWTAHSCELGGMFLQATSWKALVDTVPGAVAKLLPRGLFSHSHDIAIEVVSESASASRDASESIRGRA